MINRRESWHIIYSKALELKQDLATACGNCGYIYQQSSRRNLARTDFQKADDVGCGVGCNALRSECNGSEQIYCIALFIVLGLISILLRG